VLAVKAVDAGQWELKKTQPKPVKKVLPKMQQATTTKIPIKPFSFSFSVVLYRRTGGGGKIC
jgi:hypothetical protein